MSDKAISMLPVICFPVVTHRVTVASPKPTTTPVTTRAGLALFGTCHASSCIAIAYRDPFRVAIDAFDPPTATSSASTGVSDDTRICLGEDPSNYTFEYGSSINCA